MKDCKISDDGKVTGTAEEVLAYEAGLANPLSRMRFPYERQATFRPVTEQHSHVVEPSTSQSEIECEEMDALLAFANLAPLIGEWRKGIFLPSPDSAEWPAYRLAAAYDAACKLIPK